MYDQKAIDSRISYGFASNEIEEKIKSTIANLASIHNDVVANFLLHGNLQDAKKAEFIFQGLKALQNSLRF